jgi:hypothetical protein
MCANLRRASPAGLQCKINNIPKVCALAQAQTAHSASLKKPLMPKIRRPENRLARKETSLRKLRLAVSDSGAVRCDPGSSR